MSRDLTEATRFTEESAEGAAAQRAATHELEGLVLRAYVRREQRRWLAVAGGVLLGEGLWYVLPAALPWGGSGWLAASLIGGSPWQAGPGTPFGEITGPERPSAAPRAAAIALREDRSGKAAA